MISAGKSAICAGIVSFNPDISRIEENVSAISHQVNEVFVYDNGSDNLDDLVNRLDSLKNVIIIQSAENRGVAFALNRLCDKAVEKGYLYIVTLDQDSVCVPGMVQALALEMDDKVGIVSPQIFDRNKEDLSQIEDKLDHRVLQIEEAARKGVITSGCLTSLVAYKAVGGFDESFFIDYVDYDFNKRLLLEGFKIIRSGNTGLIHECGNFKPTWLWIPRKDQSGKWKFEKIYSFGHPPFRCYYKARNRILYSRKYSPIGAISGFEGSRQIFFQIVLVLLFEDDKGCKLKEFLRGIQDGRARTVEPYAVKRRV